MTETNWAGNITYSTSRVLTPESVAEVQDLVRSVRKLRVLGSRHSFNRIADSDENLVSLAKLNRVVSLDPARRTVKVEGGIKYGELCAPLEQAGLALHNLASLPHISVAGACATATHGSGVRNGNLATIVSALEIVNAAGEVMECSREKDGERFNGMVVSLGALGIVTKLTLELVPSFVMQQQVYENLSLPELEAHYDEIMSSAYSVSLFTDWRTNNFNQVWVKRALSSENHDDPPGPFFGTAPASTDLHPIRSVSPVNCTAQMGVSGPWYERLPHFRMDFTPSSGAELQSEYFVPHRFALAAIAAVAQLSREIAPLLQISEIRTIAADDLWLSPCYQQPCTALHFTWLMDWERVRAVLPLIEAALEPFAARPHWGKLFTMSPAHVQSLYPRLAAFRSLAQSVDPHGKFRNAFINTYVMA